MLVVGNTTRISRNLGSSLLIALIIALCAAGSALADATPSNPVSDATTNAVPGQLIVGFDKGTSTSASHAIVSNADSNVAARLPGQAGAAVVTVDPGTSPAEAATELNSTTGVAYAEPNYIMHGSAITNDNLLADGTLWGLLRIHAPAAWDVTRGAGTTVAVLDSGIAFNAPDLIHNIWQNPNEVVDGIDNDNDGFIDDVYGADWVRHDGTPDDEEGHGTHVSGTIAASADDGGAVGVAPSAKIMPLKFLDGNGAGSVADAISAIDYAIAHGANVINASWGGPDYSRALEDAIDRANAAGITFVTAAGNDGTDNDTSPDYPAALNLPNVISVAATDKNNNLASFSNYGDNTVDVAAPGVNITSTVGDHYESWSGTSMATPHVTGIVALLHSADPSASPAQLKSAVIAGSSPVASLAGKIQSGGVVDTVGAFRQIGISLSTGTSPRAFRLKTPGKKVTVGKNGKIKFAWTASGDDDFLGYEVYVDGKLKANVDDPDGPEGPLSAPTAKSFKLKAGKHKWNVVAVDEAGNERAAGKGSAKGRIAVLARVGKKH